VAFFQKLILKISWIDISLSPSFTLNYLELAKAYKKNNQKKNAIPLLRYALTIPNRTEDDERIKKEAAELLKEWE
jgi:hypothetical protein